MLRCCTADVSGPVSFNFRLEISTFYNFSMCFIYMNKVSAFATCTSCDLVEAGAVLVTDVNRLVGSRNLEDEVEFVVWCD